MTPSIFEVVRIVESSVSSSCEFDTNICCIDGSGNNLFVGLSNGLIILLSIESSPESVQIVANEWIRAVVSPRPILALKFCSAFNRLFILTDGSLFYPLLEDLQDENTSSYRKVSSSVSCFSLNEDPSTDNPYLLQLALGTTRREIIIAEILNEEFKKKSAVETEDIPICIVYDGLHLCYSTRSAYYVLDIGSKLTTKLFDIGSETARPIIKRIGKDEFLLSHQSENLGFFANGSGISTRPPLLWLSNVVLSIAFVHPYVVCVGEQFLSIYDILSGSVKQHIPFPGAKIIGDFEGQIFVVSRKEMFQLQQISWQKQVDVLLNEKLTDEAMTLLSISVENDRHSSDLAPVVRNLQTKAAFQYFAKGSFPEARDLFLRGRVDAREIICLYPGLLAEGLHFIPTTPPFHDIPDVNFAIRHSKSDSVDLKTYEKFLCQLLQQMRIEVWTLRLRKLIDTALMKLMAELDMIEELKIMMTSSEEQSDETNINIDRLEIDTFCKAREKYQFLALYLWLSNEEENRKSSIAIWKNLSSGTLKDPTFKSCQNFFDLIQCSQFSLELISSNLDWFLERDFDGFIKILSKFLEAAQIHTIIDWLDCKNDVALVCYLDSILQYDANERQDLHLKLYKKFVDLIILNSDSVGKLDPISFCDKNRLRRMFQQFLFKSTNYPVFNTLKVIMDSNKTADLLYERAILHGKLKEHDKALRILVESLRNEDAVQEYCRFMCNKSIADQEERRKIYTSLFNIYLSNNDGEAYTRVRNLLNNSSIDLDLSDLLKMLPSQWSVQELNKFLIDGVVKCRYKKSNAFLAKSIAESLDFSLKTRKVELEQKKINLTENRQCFVCHKDFQEAEFIAYPDGRLSHRLCAKSGSLIKLASQSGQNENFL